MLLTFPRQRERKRALSTLGGVGKGTIRKGVPYRHMYQAMIGKSKTNDQQSDQNIIIYRYWRSEFKFFVNNYCLDGFFY